MSAGVHTHPFGTTLGYSSNGSSYTLFADLVSVQIPDDEFDKSDDSTLNNLREEITTIGWLKQTAAEFVLWFIASVLAALYSGDFGPGTNGATTVLYWEVTYPLIASQSNNSTNVFQGWISKIARNKAEKLSNDKVQVPLTVEKQGLVIFTAGS